MLRMTKRHRLSAAAGGGGLSLMDIVGESDEDGEEEEDEEEEDEDGEEEELLDTEEEEEDEEDEEEQEADTSDGEQEAEEVEEEVGLNDEGELEGGDGPIAIAAPEHSASPADAWSDGPEDSAMSLGTAEDHPDLGAEQHSPQESEDGDDLVQMGVYGTARPDSPQGLVPFPGAGPIGAWTSVAYAAPAVVPPEDPNSPYWYAYSSYQQAMRSPVETVADVCAASTVCCASTSYGSSATGTTVETLSSSGLRGVELVLGRGSEERISECTADAGDAGDAAGADWDGSADFEDENDLFEADA